MAAVGTILRLDDTGNITLYTPASDSDTARGTALKTAVDASTAGDLIDIGPGTYQLAELDTLTLKANQTLAGAGWGLTVLKFINSNTPQIRTGIKYVDGCEIRDLKAIYRNVADNAYAAGFVMGNSDTSGTLSAVIRNCWLIGLDDGIHCLGAHTEHLRLYSIRIDGGYDCIVWRPTGTNSTFKMYESSVVLDQATIGAAAGGLAVGLGAAASTNQTFEIFNSQIHATTNAGQPAHALRQDTGTLTLNGTAITTAGPSTNRKTIYCLNDGHHSFASALNIGPGCSFDADRVDIASGVTVTGLGPIVCPSTAENPLDGTAGNRPKSAAVGSLVFYTGDSKVYVCTSRTTPTWVALH
jgi:hypothetical protein